MNNGYEFGIRRSGQVPIVQNNVPADGQIIRFFALFSVFCRVSLGPATWPSFAIADDIQEQIFQGGRRVVHL